MDADQISAVAHDISDLGIMIVIAAIFVLLSGGMWLAIFSWFRTLINSMVSDNQEVMRDLLVAMKRQGEQLTHISEAARRETLEQVKSISEAFFELSKEQVCRLIKTIRKENHIADRKATAAKIRMLLQNIHDERNSRFDAHTYRGRALSKYADSAWIEQVAHVVEGEIYNADGANNGRAYTNVAAMYDMIKNDFFRKLHQ